jgi:CheY-like chemotaxis protein
MQMRLLIVEDNPRMRRLLKSLAADFADEIFECEDGSEAFSSYAENQPDLVLMDVQMRDLDGISASRQIKQKFPQAKIVIVTNYDEPEVRQAVFDLGVSGFVLKENLLPLFSYFVEGKAEEN